jgi:membrane peptidoglycan carboxypeptidase
MRPLLPRTRFFYINVGVDPIAIARAVYYNVSEGEIVSGASTITQQLARNVLINPEERTERTMIRKVKEAVLAVEINRRYSKQQILEIYLNQIYYGNLAYGIEAAAQTYFGKPAADLTLSEAALLAGLPQSPANHDPYVNPGRRKKPAGRCVESDG